MKFEKVSKETFRLALVDSFIKPGKNEDKFEYSSSCIAEEILDFIDLPKRSTVASAGYDFQVPFDMVIHPGETVIIPTGIKVKLDPDKVLMIAPRSSIGIKKRLKLANTQAYIDADYYNNPSNEGHILIALTSENDHNVTLERKDKIAQGIIIQYFTTEDDDCTETRTGGIGSTGE